MWHIHSCLTVWSVQSFESYCVSCKDGDFSCKCNWTVQHWVCTYKEIFYRCLEAFFMLNTKNKARKNDNLLWSVFSHNIQKYIWLFQQLLKKSMTLPPTQSATQRLARQTTAGTLPPEFTMSRPVLMSSFFLLDAFFPPQSLSQYVLPRLPAPHSLCRTLAHRWASLSLMKPIDWWNPAGPLPWQPLWLWVSPLSTLHDIDLWHWAACLDWSGRLEWDAIYTWGLLLLY